MNANVQAALQHGCHSALMHFEQNGQKVAAVEEMGELIRVLAKDINNRVVDRAELIDEIADVLIMTNQLRIIYGEDEVDARILVKLEKLMDKIRKREGYPVKEGVTI